MASVVHTPITDNVNWNSRNFILGPSSWSQDVTAFKYFDLTERFKMRFSADFFNVFNHPNNVYPNTTTGLVDLSRQPTIRALFSSACAWSGSFVKSESLRCFVLRRSLTRGRGVHALPLRRPSPIGCYHRSQS